MQMNLMFDHVFSITCWDTESEIISIAEFGSDDNNGIYGLIMGIIYDKICWYKVI